MAEGVSGFMTLETTATWSLIQVKVKKKPLKAKKEGERSLLGSQPGARPPLPQAQKRTATLVSDADEDGIQTALQNLCKNMQDL